MRRSTENVENDTCTHYRGCERCALFVHLQSADYAETSVGGRLMHKRVLTAEQLDHLPSELHKMVARVLVTRGEWSIVEYLTSGDCKMVEA